MPTKAENVEQIIIGNVRQSIRLDAGLQKGTAIQKLAAKFVNQIMFNPDASSRGSAIAALQRDTVEYFEGVAVPTAVASGRQNANALIRSIGGERAARDVINDPIARRRILYEGDIRVSERVQIFQKLVADAGNTLENRLGAFWLEPGRTAGQKLDTLRRIHESGEAARVKYEQRLQTFRGGEGSRPNKPQLDYLSRFTAYTTDESRAQARRVGTDAEHNVFESRGVKVFTWVTVNAGDACPDCRRRQGTTGTMAYFDQIGKPGSGATVCGSRCFCILVPKQTIYHAPGLARGVTVSEVATGKRRGNDGRDLTGGAGGGGGGGPRPPRTPPALAAQIDAAKVPPPPKPVPVAQTPAERLRAALGADVEAGQVHQRVLNVGKRADAAIRAGERKIDRVFSELDGIDREFQAANKLPDTPDNERLLTQITQRANAKYSELNGIREKMARDAAKLTDKIHKAIAIPDAERFTAITPRIVGTPQPTAATAAIRNPETAKSIKSATNFVQSVWRRPVEFQPNAAGTYTLPVNFVENGPTFRAHHMTFVRGPDPLPNVIELREGQSAKVVAHELGHELEARHPKGFELAKTYLDTRTQGQHVRKFTEVLPGRNWRAEEKGRDDDFSKAFGPDEAWYVGKEYDFDATEIISMGLEALYANPLKFARADVEYFRFIIGFLRGTLRI